TIQKQVVATTRTAKVAIPGCTITSAHVQQVQLWVVGHGIPGRTSKSVLPETIRRPGLCSHFELRMFKAFLWITGHCIESPRHLPGITMVGCYIPARIVLRSAVANNDQVLCDIRRPGA